MPYDHYSLASLQIIIGFEDVQLSTATAFFAQYSGGVLLFTNLHVVTGRHFDTGKPLSLTAAIPNWLEIKFRMKSDLLKHHKIRIPLYDHNQCPMWIEHPNTKCDVVGLRVKIPDDGFVHTVNTELAKQDILLEPATPVSIVGYPTGISVAGSLPVWKTGTIASEHAVNVNNYHAFLIDAATRSGMSGSPVVWKVRNQYRNLNGELMFPTSAGNVFLGIYSGRHGSDDTLGFVWRPELLDSIAALGLETHA